MLNKDAIINLSDKGLDVFRHFIPGNWRIGRNFLNPLYKDTKPSCNIYYDKRADCYKIKDFGNDDYSGDCFFFVGKLFGLDCSNGKEFMQILHIIDSELNLGLSKSDSDCPLDALPPKLQTQTRSNTNKSEKIIQPYSYELKSFSHSELAFWREYGITEEVLRQYKVVSVSEYSSRNKSGNNFILHSSDESPIFGYVGSKYIKLYRPSAHDMRFMYGGDPGGSYCFGLSQLPIRGDTLFITGGEKDVLTLVAHGYYAICFGSESVTIPESIIRAMKHRFKHIILLYDIDTTGLECSERHIKALSRYNVHRLLIPLSGGKSEKDISDFFRLGHTSEEFSRLFLSFLEQLYEETFAILQPCQIDMHHPPEYAKTVVAINDVPFGTQGNLLCITGGEGSGKSNYTGALISGALCSLPPSRTLGATVTQNEQGLAVLLYDTEQSMSQLHKNSERILRRAYLSTVPDYFKVYSLCSLSRKERIQAIVESMDKYYYQYGGIHMVVIDGVADLIQSVNDEMGSVELIDELYRLAAIYRTCIVCVLHLVPSGMKIRGHLGSEIGRKSAAVVSIDKDEKRDVSCLKTLKVRDGSPLDVPLIEFSWNKELAMHTFSGERNAEEKERRKIEELSQIAKQLFHETTSYSYTDLTETIKQCLEVSTATAKNYIRFMREKQIIISEPSGNGRLCPGVI